MPFFAISSSCVPVSAIIPFSITTNPLAELSQCILDSSNGSIINVI